MSLKVPLSDLCTLITDGSHYSPKEEGGGIPMYSVKDMAENSFVSSGAKCISEEEYQNLKRNGCQPEVDDVLIAKDGSVLKHVFRFSVEEKCALLSSVAILRPNLSIIDSEFLAYSLKNPTVRENVLANYVSGSGVPRIVLKDFKRIPIAVPDMRVQKSIAAILSALDKKIAVNTSRSETLEKIAQTLFKSWFIDFEPVKAKIAGQKPSGIDDVTARLFPDSMEDSELGPIPSGWKLSQIGDEVDCVGGATPSTSNSDFWDGDIFWTTPKDLSRQVGIITTSSERRITSKGLQKISSGLLPVHSVLMSSRAPIGYLSINAVPTAINQGFIALRVSERFTPLYLLFWLQIKMSEIKNRAGGGTFAEISRTAFKSIPFIVPNEEVLQKFAEIAEPILLQLGTLTLQNQRLIELRDALLPRLMSGALQIPEEMLVP
jgi:type I restriction enzyme S subunit